MAYTKALAKQLLEKGIRANVVAPGPFWTPLQASGGQPPEAVMKFGSETQYGRPGQPVEIAPVYVLRRARKAATSAARFTASPVVLASPDIEEPRSV